MKVFETKEDIIGAFAELVGVARERVALDPYCKSLGAGENVLCRDGEAIFILHSDILPETLNGTGGFYLMYLKDSNPLIASAKFLTHEIIQANGLDFEVPRYMGEPSGFYNFEVHEIGTVMLYGYRLSIR